MIAEVVPQWRESFFLLSMGMVRKGMLMNYDSIIQESIERHKEFPVDMLGVGSTGEYTYLNQLKGSYARTVRDIDSFFSGNRGDVTILELGSYLGVVSVSLKKMGYNVCASDIPEFHKSPSLRSLYEENDISFSGVNLRSHQLPYESNTFDAVVICEVIEHLNFNPLPVLKEINRILKDGGVIYIGMPNQAHITKRMKLAMGLSIHNGIDDFFKQLDRDNNMIVGLHWREYTLAETVRMIEKMGFETIEKYYFMEGYFLCNPIKAFVLKLLYMIPSFRPYQVVVGKKVMIPDVDFWLTEANS